MLVAGAAAPLAGVFFDDSPAGFAAAELALGLLLLLGLIELVANPGLAAAGLLRGRKDTRAPMMYVLFGYWVISAPLGVYLCEVQRMGVTGIWIGLATGTFTTTALTLARLLTERR
jgi:MATE family multidrug resistance protein